MRADEFIQILRRPLTDLPAELEMIPLEAAFDVEITPPGSKSLTNRALLLAALAEGDSEIRGALLEADDARVMIDALRTLGAGIDVLDARAGLLRIRGTGGRLAGGVTLNLKNAGTATRFLTAAACLADGPVVIDGNERMRQRPIGELVELLRQLGVRVEELGAPACVPLRVVAQGRGFHPASITVGATQSSQFVSALMLAAPFSPNGLTIRFGSVLTSASYVRMSERLLREHAGVRVDGEASPSKALSIPAQTVRGFAYAVEPDASGMTPFWAAAAIVPGSRASCPGLSGNSLQGDAEFADLLGLRLGCADASTERGRGVRGAPFVPAFEADLTLMPDAAMNLAVVAGFAGGPCLIRGLRTLRVKETDRIAALQNELSKVGVRVEIVSRPDPAEPSGALIDEGIRVTPPAGGVAREGATARVEFDTYDDHRMAMSMALIGLRRSGVVIRDPGCVAKTYPGFWRDLALLYQRENLSRR